MITLHLTRAKNHEGVYLKLPAAPDEISRCFGWLDDISPDAATTEIVDVTSNVYNLSSYLKGVDIENPGELEKVGQLAVKLQTMDRDSCYLFEGVLDANSVSGIDDILRLSGSLGEYILLPGAETSSALGKYLVEHGIVAFPASVKPYLDHQIIGSEFYAEHGGAFCRGGYAVRKAELPEQFLHERFEQKRKNTMMLRLRASHPGQQKPVDATLLLPASDEALDKVRQRLGIDEFAEAEIIVADYVFPYFSTSVPQDCITVETANELALAIEQMNRTDGEMLKYLAALEVEQPDTFTEALEIAIDLDDYEAVPSDSEEYGRRVLARLGASDEIRSEIDGFMDFEAFGEAWMFEDGVVRTEFGPIRRLSQPFEPPSFEMKME